MCPPRSKLEVPTGGEGTSRKVFMGGALRSIPHGGVRTHWRGSVVRSDDHVVSMTGTVQVGSGIAKV